MATFNENVQVNGKMGINRDPDRTLDVDGVVRIHGRNDGSTLLAFRTDRPWEFRQLGAGESASLELLDTSGSKNFIINTTGRVGIGTTAPTATLDVAGSISVSDDVVLVGADCAEDFEVDAQEAIEAGMVVVIGDGERLRSCHEAYDRRVAGVLSGAGDCRPGVILGRRAVDARRLPLALSGKVFCRVDAGFAPVGVGDLLTTSPTRGHAMKANDPAKAFGAVIGKALRSLDGGRGLIPILIALQ
jgi:hypothetical protein